MNRHLYNIIADAVKTWGTYDPDKIMGMFEEQLTRQECHTIYGFLGWVHKNNKTFGHGNYQDVFKEFIKFQREGKELETRKVKVEVVIEYQCPNEIRTSQFVSDLDYLFTPMTDGTEIINAELLGAMEIK